MDVIREKCPISGTQIYIYTLSNGIKCYVIPKPGFIVSQAMAVIKFGSSAEAFEQNGESFLIPRGTAHFIEHKLFDKEDKSVFNTLYENGANVNAFTDYSKTAYYFSCQDNFYENLKELAQMVAQPYFDKIGIENEKSIIKSEINMYKDIPQRLSFTNLTKIMCPEGALGCEIAGTEKTIEKITPELLYKCYNSFYTPNNISFICCGDIEPEKVALTVQNTVFSKGKGQEIVINDKTESKNDFISRAMGVSEPIFNLGFKYNNFDCSPLNTYALKMAFDIIAGEGSMLYERLLNRQVLSEPLGFSVTVSNKGSFASVSGKSQRAAYTANSFIKTASQLGKTGLGQTALNRIKNMYCGMIIRGQNDINAICMAMADLVINGFSLCDAENAILSITAEKISHTAGTMFNRNSAYLSIVK